MFLVYLGSRLTKQANFVKIVDIAVNDVPTWIAADDKVENNCPAAIDVKGCQGNRIAVYFGGGCGRG